MDSRVKELAKEIYIKRISEEKPISFDEDVEYAFEAASSFYNYCLKKEGENTPEDNFLNSEFDEGMF